jgi:hypothetical protein
MYIQYKTEVKGLSKEQELRIPINDGSIGYVTLGFKKTQELNEILFVTFYFSRTVNRLMDAELLTRGILEDIINLMVFNFNAAIKKPIVHAYVVEEASVIASALITLHNIKVHELTIPESSWLCSEVNSSVFSSKLKINPNFLQYKAILTVEDDVSRFLLLYALLYEIKGNQLAVDNYIKTKEPSVLLLQTTRSGQSYNETIYTWWRNQAQHMQSTTDIEDVTKHFNNLVEPLQNLVFEAVKDGI